MDQQPEYSYLAIQPAPEEYAGTVDEPSDFIHEIEGKVLLVAEPAELTRQVGEFKCLIIDADGASIHGIHPFDLYDTTQATMNLYDALLTTDGPTARVLRALGQDYGLWSHNLLVLDRLVIFPEFRGGKAGLRVLAMLMQRYQRGSQIVAMKPFPLQFEGGMEADEAARCGLKQFSCTMDYARRRLQRYYGELGFTKVTGTPYMVRSTEEPLPDLERYYHPA